MKITAALVIAASIFCSPAFAREHVTNCITQEQADYMAERYILSCSVSAYPNTVRMFTAPSLSSEYLNGIGNAPADHVDMSVTQIVESDERQFLCGSATNANGYPIVRNTISGAETIIERDWCILAKDVQCSLLGPQVIGNETPPAAPRICNED